MEAGGQVRDENSAGQEGVEEQREHLGERQQQVGVVCVYEYLVLAEDGEHRGGEVPRAPTDRAERRPQVYV